MTRLAKPLTSVFAAAAGLGAMVGVAASTRRLAATANRARGPAIGALALPADAEVVQAADGARLAVTIEGTGPTVVLLHGWAADRAAWNTVAAALVERGRRVVRYDMCGHGRSSAGSGDLSLSRLVADLDAVLDAALVRDAVVVGHSLGSLTAIGFLSGLGDPTAAATARDRVRAAVLASAATPDPRVGPVAMAVSAMVVRSPVLEWLVSREQLGLTLMDPFAGDRRVVADARAQRAAYLATPAPVRAGLLPAIQHDFVPELAPYATPTTVIVGSADQLAVPERARRLAEVLPDAGYVELQGCGHNLPYEAPDALVDAITAW